jgi:hypothetical protein
MGQTDPDEELDVVDSALNPMVQNDKRFMLIAGLTLPVLIDRAGGSVTLSDTDLEELNGRYGGRVAVQMQKTPDGRIRAWLVPSRKRPKTAQA